MTAPGKRTIQCLFGYPLLIFQHKTSKDVSCCRVQLDTKNPDPP